MIFPSLLQLQRGITDVEDKKQKAVCMERYRKKDEDERGSLSDIDVEREEECGICMEMNSKVVLPNCTHAMCLRCYQDWYAHNSVSAHVLSVTALSVILIYSQISIALLLLLCKCKLLGWALVIIIDYKPSS